MKRFWVRLESCYAPGTERCEPTGDSGLPASALHTQETSREKPSPCILVGWERRGWGRTHTSPTSTFPPHYCLRSSPLPNSAKTSKCLMTQQHRTSSELEEHEPATNTSCHHPSLKQNRDRQGVARVFFYWRKKPAKGWLLTVIPSSR